MCSGGKGGLAMKRVVVTGSTRGIGFGLAEAFLDLGCAVAVSGRTQAGVDAATALLAARHGSARVCGQPCDVTQYDQVLALWDAAVERLGGVDIWISNAGLGHPLTPLWEIAPQRLQTVVATNLLGALYSAKVALGHMIPRGAGSLYQLEGFGSDGRKMSGLSLYGVTKNSLTYLTDALAREVRGSGVIVGALRPGMVVTDLVTGQFEGRPAEWERFKRVLNIIADRVETVAPVLARRVLANERNGAHIRWLSGLALTMRFATAPFARRRLVD
jgi:NAD(P)-dependent dehydrogenase (short-subunit alcohol dehydrogenase family)